VHGDEMGNFPLRKFALLLVSSYGMFVTEDWEKRGGRCVSRWRRSHRSSDSVRGLAEMWFCRVRYLIVQISTSSVLPTPGSP
jgi:hypothetical protein